MRIITLGDTAKATRYISKATALLSSLKERMCLANRKQGSDILDISNTRIEISSVFGYDRAIITSKGGGFIVMGYAETADDVRHLGNPGKGQKYLLYLFSLTGTPTKRAVLGNDEYPFGGSDWLWDQLGEHRLAYLSEKEFYTGKFHDFDYVDDIPSRVYAWQIRKLDHADKLKYEVTEPGVEGSAVVFFEDTDAIYVYGERLVRDPDPGIWYMASRTEKRMKASGELVWEYNVPVYWNQSRGAANATHLFISYAVLMYNPLTAHDQYFPTIIKQDKTTGTVIWYVQNDPGVYAGVGGWSVATGYLVNADADFHYVAWLEWQNPAPDLGYMLRFRVSKVANADGTTVEWSTEHTLPFAVADSNNLRIVGSARHGRRITYCGAFISYPEGYYIRVAFCLDTDTGEVVWHQEYTPAGTIDEAGHIVKSSGFYNDMKYARKNNTLIMAGAEDPDVELNMTTAIMDIRNAETGDLIKTVRSTNNGLFTENSMVRVIGEANA